MNRRSAWFGALLMLALLVLPVLAGIDMEGANAATATPASFTTTTAGVDSSDPIGTTPIRGLKVLGNPTLYISGLHCQGAASVTATFTAELYGPDSDDEGTDPDYMGRAVLGTVTFGSSASGERYYPTSSGIVADILAGATIVDVRCTAISEAGATVTWKRWVGVANTRGPSSEAP